MNSFFTVISKDVDVVKFNDTDYKEIWSPKRMQDTLVSLLSKVDGIINDIYYINAYINSFFTVIRNDFNEIKFNDTDYKEIWSPKRMQNTIELLLNSDNGIFNIVFILFIRLG